MSKSLILRVILFVGLACVLVGCRQSQQATAPPSVDSPQVSIALQVTPDPAVVGEALLLITLRDAADSPIEDASISVRGDMNHAGMVPVLRNPEDFTQETPGVYSAPFEWTMGGDWFVVVSVALADGSSIEQQFDLNVGRSSTDGPGAAHG